jgi:hypothetical protein
MVSPSRRTCTMQVMAPWAAIVVLFVSWIDRFGSVVTVCSCVSESEDSRSDTSNGIAYIFPCLRYAMCENFVFVSSRSSRVASRLSFSCTIFSSKIPKYLCYSSVMPDLVSVDSSPSPFLVVSLIDASNPRLSHHCSITLCTR